MGKSFWQKDSLTTHILFELWLIMIFSPPGRKLAKRTSVQCSVLVPRHNTKKCLADIILQDAYVIFIFRNVGDCTEVHFASFLSGGLNIIISHSSKSI